MPFKSEKQKRFLWANEPEIARRWSEKYGGVPKRRKSTNTKKRRPKNG